MTTTLSSRIPTTTDYAIHWTRRLIKFFVNKQRGDKSKPYRYQICALHHVLNRLRNKPCSHVVTKPSHGFTNAGVLDLAEGYYAVAMNRTPTDELRCYVSIDAKTALTLSQQGVQAGHALIELAQHYHGHPDYDKWAKTDLTLIYVIDNYRYVPGIPMTPFYDSDFKRTTATAYLPMTRADAERIGFSKLKLWGT